DLDYSSREFSLWPLCEMKWTFGLRTLFLFFDSQADQPLDPATGGIGIVQRGESSSLSAVGPHAGLELSRHIPDTGLAVTLRSEGATNRGRIQERYFTLATPGSGGGPLAGETRLAHFWNTPSLNVEAGLSWHSPFCSGAVLFLGYRYEYWWRVGGNLESGARA